jgi:hypothetical protein
MHYNITLPCLQEPVICPCPEADNSSYTLRSHFFEIHVNVQGIFSLQVLRQKNMCFLWYIIKFVIQHSKYALVYLNMPLRRWVYSDVSKVTNLPRKQPPIVDWTIFQWYSFAMGGTRWRSRKGAGSIPDGFTGIFSVT